MTNAITFEGNLADDPNLSFTSNKGIPVADFVALVNRRVRDEAGEWSDATPTRHRVKVYGRIAEHVAELSKGATVVVHGQVETDSWVDKSTGEIRYGDLVVAVAVGASLRFGAVSVTKANRDDA